MEYLELDEDETDVAYREAKLRLNGETGMTNDAAFSLFKRMPHILERARRDAADEAFFLGLKKASHVVVMPTDDMRASEVQMLLHFFAQAWVLLKMNLSAEEFLALHAAFQRLGVDADILRRGDLKALEAQLLAALPNRRF